MAVPTSGDRRSESDGAPLAGLAGPRNLGLRPPTPRVDTRLLLAAVLIASSPILLSIAGDTPDRGGPGGSATAVAASPPTPVPSPTPTPRQGVVTVSSIPALLEALDDDANELIIVADGTYQVSPSGELAADSLWIGERYADRTRPVTVRAETRGGVTFDGTGGGEGYGGLSFEDGAHDQTWEGFNFANMAAHNTGIIEIGGYTPRSAPRDITLNYITIEGSNTGSAISGSAPATEHAVYIANALDPGPQDLSFSDITVDGRGGLASAFHFFHSAPGAPNATGVTVQRLQVIGTQQAIIMWDSTLRDIRFDTVDITGAMTYAVRYETVGSTGIVLSNITSTGSGFAGFYSSEGASPAGVTFSNSSFE